MSSKHLVQSIPLLQIGFDDASKLLQGNSIVIYVTINSFIPDTSHNTFMLSGKTKQGDFNMYMGAATPAQIGLEAIVNWIKEREQPDSFINFYTFGCSDFFMLPLA